MQIEKALKKNDRLRVSFVFTVYKQNFTAQ